MIKLSEEMLAEMGVEKPKTPAEQALVKLGDLEKVILLQQQILLQSIKEIGAGMDKRTAYEFTVIRDGNNLIKSISALPIKEIR